METIIKDNFLPIPFLNNLEDYLLYNVPHYWGHSSIENSPPFYFSKLDSNDSNLVKIYNLISNTYSPKSKLLRTYSNIQHLGMDGTFHKDDGDVTFLIMVTKNPIKGGGEFEYIDKNNKTHTISYQQNRLIIFDAQLKHRGLAYKDNKPRITLAYKTKINNKSSDEHNDR